MLVQQILRQNSSHLFIYLAPASNFELTSLKFFPSNIKKLFQIFSISK